MDNTLDEQDDPVDVLGKPPDGKCLEPGTHNLGQVGIQPPVASPHNRQNEDQEYRRRDGEADGTEDVLGLTDLPDLVEGQCEVPHRHCARVCEGLSGQFVYVRRVTKKTPLSPIRICIPSV